MVGKPKGNRQHERYKRRLEDDIKVDSCSSN